MEKIRTQLKINGKLRDIEIKNGEIIIIEPEPKKKNATGWENTKNKYSIDSTGQAFNCIDSMDKPRYKNANIFSNKQLAVNISRMQTLQRQIFRWQAENDIPINLNSGNIAKYYIVYDLDNNGFNVCSIYTKLHSFLPCFSSRNKAIECITEFENELRWLFTEFQWRIDYDNNSTPHKESSVNKND